MQSYVPMNNYKIDRACACIETLAIMIFPKIKGIHKMNYL